MTNENAPNPKYILVFLAGMLASALFGQQLYGNATVNDYDREVPLVDHAALAAHADSAGIPRAAAYGLAWMESRTGKCMPKCPRGPGRVVVDSIREDSLGQRHVYQHRICREIGRMQINPCARLDRGNARCEWRRVRDNIHDNYACGMWYYSTLLLRYQGDHRRAFSRYNGGNPEYARAALAQVGDWWIHGLLAEEDRR